MSEITTGTVSLSLISLPLTIGVAVIGSVYFASKYCIKKYDSMLKDIETTDARLKWLDKNKLSSAKKIAVETKKIQQSVAKNKIFIQMSRGLTKGQREILSGVIATEKSPLKSYIPSLLKEMPENNCSFEAALKQGVKNFALDNFKFVSKVVKDTARATGFTSGTKILRQKESILDIVFTDNQNRKFAAYCKIDKEMNPSLALDLEGFDCNNDECSLKMNEIISYLQSNGIPFKYKRLRHNQPMGVLRNLLEQKKQNEIKNYLYSGNENVKQKIKQY
jgi:hypothetical protein